MKLTLSSEKQKILPIAPIRKGVIFPHIETVLTFGRPQSVAAVEAAFQNDRLICFFSQKNFQVQNPGQGELYQMGTLGRIERLLRTENDLHAWVKGLSRVALGSIQANQAFLVGQVVEVPEILESSDEMTALTANLVKRFQQAISAGKAVDVMTVMRLLGESTPAELADQIAYILEVKTAEKQALLETLPVKDRLLQVTRLLDREIKVLELERTIASKTQLKFDRNMREAMLRERKKAIEEELGEGDEGNEIKELQEKIKKAQMPKSVAQKAQKELKRLQTLNPAHPEVSYIRTYLDWLTDLPWSKATPNNIPIKKAARVLNEDHYGLDKVKERVVEYLAVMKLKEKSRTKDVRDSTILCFSGPPGVGKTSLGKSIARALGRKFVRISLGGIRDEAEIRGHRRTYVGAMPGRIIQSIKNIGSNNPVFMLDEIDKVGADFRGDPSAALLEALDPEQNNEFSDHYLEVPFDLSKVMFITTANVLYTIPPALRDRMEIIPFPGYTEDEKFAIAKKFLWQKQLVANGLPKNQLKISDAALHEVIQRYTREAGVRELERNLATICRKVARKIAEKEKPPVGISRQGLAKYLGPRKFSRTLAEKGDEVGIVTGLAYTQAGGDILFIEVALMPGKGQLFLTGKLGEVMKESGKAALSYVRSHWQQLGLKQDFYKSLDIHIHVPEGAIPKDGPSAGVAIAMALISALTKRPARKQVGMTGEVTLRGRVLEIGGVKEKVIAAHRAGLKTVILPKDNKKDLVDVPAKVKKDIKFIFASQLDEVLKVALAK
ncbi:endopeptidase La [Candidatus Shapirobacteria bacterium CG09_land_8_20_14_0_10_49_15]|uniref:Lon protease n=2 Tax=Candidatus Shapironibacteriota TaxID=1752721 RepID=A0A2M8L703_9BACT|nr:MAG: endopeptidase La [Candidatus Shapirobacteria bacterium CG09_land_8_20_14_0_10_49_15]PJE69968.1 MAG: endopeptidase La [Candidatus Shapirobacteria bacterium CG10_big_fil_rev_8_21_14_0_10_48_15]